MNTENQRYMPLETLTHKQLISLIEEQYDNASRIAQERDHYMQLVMTVRAILSAQQSMTLADKMQRIASVLTGN